jgi:hypothetical protein
MWYTASRIEWISPVKLSSKVTWYEKIFRVKFCMHLSFPPCVLDGQANLILLNLINLIIDYKFTGFIQHSHSHFFPLIQWVFRHAHISKSFISSYSSQDQRLLYFSFRAYTYSIKWVWKGIINYKHIWICKMANIKYFEYYPGIHLEWKRKTAKKSS